MKRILTVLMSAIMVLSMMPAMAFAVAGDTATGYGEELLPAKPEFSGDVIKVNPSNIQYTLDGAYGRIDGKTIVLSEGNYGKIELGRATKYPGSGTEYYIGGISEENRQSFDKFYEIKTSGKWSASAYYVRNMSNVTIKAEDGAEVSIAGMIASSGHVYGNVYDYVLDKAYESGSAYYLSQKINNIKFENLTFTAKVDITTSSADTEIDGISFTNCSFNIGNTNSGNQALRYYNENDNGKVKNLTVDNCEFNTCYQGVYTQKINGVKVVNSEFDTTGHNAIAIQSGSGSVNHKCVLIKGNTFVNIGDRIIRFGDVGADTQITIQGNKATYSGDSEGQVIKAQSLAEGIKYSISGNDWGEGTSVANTQLEDQVIVATVGDTGYTSLADAVSAAESGQMVKLVEDVSISDCITIDKDLNLNLNGKSVSSTVFKGRTFEVADAVDFMIDGTVEGSSMKIPEGTEDSYGFIKVSAAANVTVRNGNYSGNTGGGAFFKVFEGADGATINLENLNANTDSWIFDTQTIGSTISLNVIGGKYNTEGVGFGFDSIGQSPISFQGVTVNAGTGPCIENSGGTAEFRNCNFNVDTEYSPDFYNAAIAVSWEGRATIFSGRYSSVGRALHVYSSGGTITTKGGVFSGQKEAARVDASSSNGNKGLLDIQGGDFSGGFSKSNTIVDGNSLEKISISGGSYSSNPKEFVAEGKNIYHQKTGKYFVGSMPASTSGYNAWALQDGIYEETYVAPSEPETPDAPVIDNSGSGDDATTNVDASGSTVVEDAKAETSISETTGKEIVDKAIENKSTEIVIKAETEKGDSTGSTVALPESTVQALAKDTEASVTIKTDSAEVSLDKAAVDAVAAQAGTDGEVKLVVETKEQNKNKVEIELKLVTSKGTVSDFQGGNVTVTVPVNEELAGKKLVCVYIDENGKYTKMEGKLAADGKSYTFTTGHFSTYAILSEEEADAIIAEQNKASDIASAKVTGVVNKTYTGKSITQNPVVTVGESKLVKGTDYTVSYKNNVNSGVATLTIEGAGSYTGTITKTFKINPKGTSISKVTGQKKAVKVVWKKQLTKMKSSYVSGYQVQYSTSSKFTSGTSKYTNAKFSKGRTTKTIKNLKAGKKYYVRVRTYKNVDGTRCYSSWSSAKSVKTK